MPFDDNGSHPATILRPFWRGLDAERQRPPLCFRPRRGEEEEEDDSAKNGSVDNLDPTRSEPFSSPHQGTSTLPPWQVFTPAAKLKNSKDTEPVLFTSNTDEAATSRNEQTIPVASTEDCGLKTPAEVDTFRCPNERDESPENVRPNVAATADVGCTQSSCDHCRCASRVGSPAKEAGGLPRRDSSLLASTPKQVQPSPQRQKPRFRARPAGEVVSAGGVLCNIGETLRFMRYRSFLRWYEGAHGRHWSRFSATLFLIGAALTISFAYVNVCPFGKLPQWCLYLSLALTIFLCLVHIALFSTTFTIKWTVRISLFYITWALLLVLIDNAKASTMLYTRGFGRSTAVGMYSPLNARAFVQNPDFRSAIVKEVAILLEKKLGSDGDLSEISNEVPRFSLFPHSYEFSSNFSSENSPYAKAAATLTRAFDNDDLESNQFCNAFIALPVSFWPLQVFLAVIGIYHVLVAKRLAKYYYLKAPWFLDKWVITSCSPVKLLVPALGQADKEQYRLLLLRSSRGAGGSPPVAAIAAPGAVDSAAMASKPAVEAKGREAFEKPDYSRRKFDRLRISSGVRVECARVFSLRARLKDFWNCLCCGCCRRRCRDKKGSGRVRDKTSRKSLSRVTFIGEVDAQGRPEGFGFWKDDSFFMGERLVGYWSSGFPNGPHKSREVGTGSGFMCIRIGWARYTLSDDNLTFGVANVECSVSGKFYRGFPHVKFLYPPLRRHKVLIRKVRKQHRDDNGTDTSSPIAKTPSPLAAPSRLQSPAKDEDTNSLPPWGLSSDQPTVHKTSSHQSIGPSPRMVLSPAEGGASPEGGGPPPAGGGPLPAGGCLSPTVEGRPPPTTGGGSTLRPGGALPRPAQAFQAIKRGAMNMPQHIRATGVAASAAVFRRLRRRDIEFIARLEQSRRDISWCLAELSPHTPNFGMQPKSEMVITVDYERGLYISGYILDDPGGGTGVHAESPNRGSDTRSHASLVRLFDQVQRGSDVMGNPSPPLMDIESGGASGDESCSSILSARSSTLYATPQSRAPGFSALAEAKAWKSPPVPTRAVPPPNYNRGNPPPPRDRWKGSTDHCTIAESSRPAFARESIHQLPFPSSSTPDPEPTPSSTSPPWSQGTPSPQQQTRFIDKLRRARLSLPQWKVAPASPPTVVVQTARDVIAPGEELSSHTPFYRRPTLDRQVNKADLSELRVRVVRRELLTHDNMLEEDALTFTRPGLIDSGVGETECVCECHSSERKSSPDESRPIYAVPELEADGWTCMDSAGSPECLVYVHGYNNSHVESLQILGQMAAFGNYPNHIRLFVFSWPAGSGFWQFFTAQKAAEDPKTHKALADFLRALRDNGIRQIHILCHSMGTRLFLRSFRMMTDNKGNSNLFQNVVSEDKDLNQSVERRQNKKLQLVSVTFLNPEYSLEDFVVEDYQRLRKFCHHVSIFADANDQALWWSETLSRKAALGKSVFGLWTLIKSSNDDNDYALKQPPQYLNTVSFFHFSVGASFEDTLFGGSAPNEFSKITDGRRLAENLVQWLDLDVIDTTFVDQNVHSMRHSFWNLNREIIEDIRELMITRKRARQRVGRLDRRAGNVWVYRVAPSYLTSLFDFSI